MNEKDLKTGPFNLMERLSSQKPLAYQSLINITGFQVRIWSKII